jgi:DNA-binding NtrC family response regulator
MDDDPYWRTFSAKALESAGFRVEVSSGLDDLSDCLEAQPDIVTLGYAAIGHRELEAINTIFDHSSHHHVLVFSTSLPLQTVRLLFRLGAADVTRKPFAPEELVELVKEESHEASVRSSYQEVRLGGQKDG